MQASREEILSVLRKWPNEQSPVRVSFWFSSATGSLTGFVNKAEKDAIVVSQPETDEDTAPGTLMAIPLGHATGFAFADPGEATSPEHRTVLESEMESMVMISFITGERLAIAVLPNHRAELR
jgi:hypothetical protein